MKIGRDFKKIRIFETCAELVGHPILSDLRLITLKMESTSVCLLIGLEFFGNTQKIKKKISYETWVFWVRYVIWEEQEVDAKWERQVDPMLYGLKEKRRRRQEVGNLPGLVVNMWGVGWVQNATLKLLSLFSVFSCYIFRPATNLPLQASKWSPDMLILSFQGVIGQNFKTKKLMMIAIRYIFTKHVKVPQQWNKTALINFTI